MTVDLSGVDFAKVDSINAEPFDIDWTPPSVLPPSWEMTRRGIDGAAYRSRERNLAAMLSVSRELDGRVWMHMSVSHRSRIPTWQELAWVKSMFLGDREAYQVLPPQRRYVNIHPHVLHLFALLEGDSAALPDFTRGTGSL